MTNGGLDNHFRSNSQQISKFFYVKFSNALLMLHGVSCGKNRVEGCIRISYWIYELVWIFSIYITSSFRPQYHIHPMIPSVRHLDFHQARPLICLNEYISYKVPNGQRKRAAIFDLELVYFIMMLNCIPFKLM